MHATELNVAIEDLQFYAEDVMMTANVVISRYCFPEDDTELF